MMENINIYSDVAVYEQIENHVQFAIASGRLKSGDQLPTVRALSEKLDINPNTVAKAYRDLEVMGLLYARRGMGVARAHQGTSHLLLAVVPDALPDARPRGRYAGHAVGEQAYC